MIEANSNLTVAQNMSRDLEEFAKAGDRQQVIQRARDTFFAARAETNIKLEEVRWQALQKMVDRMPEMTISQLTRTVQMLSEMGVADMTVLTGTPAGGKSGGVNVINQVHTGPINGMKATVTAEGGISNPVKDMGDLIEAAMLISNVFKNYKGNIIDQSPNITDIPDENKP